MQDAHVAAAHWKSALGEVPPVKSSGEDRPRRAIPTRGTRRQHGKILQPFRRERCTAAMRGLPGPKRSRPPSKGDLNPSPPVHHEVPHPDASGRTAPVGLLHGSAARLIHRPGLREDSGAPAFRIVLLRPRLPQRPPPSFPNQAGDLHTICFNDSVYTNILLLS